MHGSMYFSKFKAVLFLQFYEKIPNLFKNKFDAILNCLLLKNQIYNDEKNYDSDDACRFFDCFLRAAKNE